jgi:hypothetical protein
MFGRIFYLNCNFSRKIEICRKIIFVKMTLGIVVGLILSEKVKIILTNFCEKGY